MNEQLADRSLPFPVLEQFLGMGKTGSRLEAYCSALGESSQGWPEQLCPVTTLLYFYVAGYFKKLSASHRKIGQRSSFLLSHSSLIITPYESAAISL